MTGCCTLPPREAPAIPLWINGRPVLAMPTEFNEIREAATQRLIRRVPMVDKELGLAAIANAQTAVGLTAANTPNFLSELLLALEELEAHFSGLSAVESQTHLEAGKADVENAIGYVRQLLEQQQAVPNDASCVGQTWLGLAGPGIPLSAAIKLILPVLIKGGSVVLVPDANASSCALALAELCVQCGLPDGLFNVIYVRDPVVISLVETAPLQGVRLFGPSAWSQAWQALALRWPVPYEVVMA